MRKFVFSLLAACLSVGARAQCPDIVNCPSGSPTVCDFSNNDTLLWHDSPHTWSSTIGSEDLYEGAADLSLKILPCPNGALKITYVLLLDLDNDDLLETAVPSNAFPPAGFVYANNAFNPGYPGGEPVKFDKRPVPDSLYFRFALEISNSWDTVIASVRWKTGSNYVVPQLPEGKHRLMWWVEQSGVTSYCEHSFRLKDCQPPALECPSNWSILVEPDSTASLSLNEIPFDAEDNTTPSQSLKFSMRKAGEGIGFPLDSLNDPVTELNYTCPEIENQALELWARDRLNNLQSCLITLNIIDNEGICNTYPTLCARPFWDTTTFLKTVHFKMMWVDTAQKLQTHALQNMLQGCALMNFLPPANSFSLVAEHDSFPLNGVSTYDLLLISRHILAIQPFDAPWKWIAADANRNGAVTTFDMVELRKLILGIYSKLPANTSWRFFAADCIFPPNPFTGGYCPPEYTFLTTAFDHYPLQMPFNGIKTGDINGTASADFASPKSELRGNPFRFQLPDLNLQPGETYEIPLRVADSDALLGFQFSLYFDSEFVEIENVSLGSLPDFDENSWAEPALGTLNVSWFNPAPQVILPDENLLVLKVKSLRSAPLSEAVQLKNEKLAAEVYTADEAIHPLQIHFSKNETSAAQTAFLPPQPNPTSAGVRIPIRLEKPETVRIEVLDLSGKLLWFNESPLENGAQMLEIPASAFPQAGVFGWRVSAGEAAQSGKIVRQ